MPGNEVRVCRRERGRGRDRSPSRPAPQSGAVRRRTTSPMVPRGRTPSPTISSGPAAALAQATPEESAMPLSSRLYNVFFRRTSTFALTIVVGALVFERAFDQAADAFYEHLNQGKLWKHIKHKYETEEK